MTNGFHGLMDDMKQGLMVFAEHKKLVLVALLTSVIMFAGIMILLFTLFVATVFGIFALWGSSGQSVTMIFIGGILILLNILVFLTLQWLIELGTISLIKGVLAGEVVTFKGFMQGVKAHFFQVLVTKIILWPIYVVGSLLLIIPLLLYIATIGIATGVYGLIVPGILFQTLLGFWMILLVEGTSQTPETGLMAGFRALKRNLCFGRQHFWLLMGLFFLQALIAQQAASVFGPLAAAIGGAFIAVMVQIYFKMVVLLTYRRYEKKLP